jgi:hypothetical protein
MPAVCLLVLALTVSGCANFQAALRTSAALEGAGYQGVNVNVATGTGEPAGGLISVAYSGEPTSNEQRDAQQAEKIVWDTFPGRFGAVAVIKDSGGCAGPVCATQSSEIADAMAWTVRARLRTLRSLPGPRCWPSAWRS